MGRFGFTALVVAWLIAAAVPAVALDRQSVWLSSDSSAPDMLDLFRHPEPWARARERVGVFKFVPPHVDPRMAPARNSYAALKDAGAFVLLRQWGIRIAVEEGAVKEWDCTGTKQAAPATIGHIANIAAAGAALQVVAMDEPLVSGQGACALSIDDIAARTAAYARAVRGSKEVQASGEPIAIGDIEPYPLPDAATLMTWVRSLIARGLKPAFLHLDINLHYVDVHPEIRLADDLRRLNAFFHETGIPLGIIIWSGYDPLNADRAYYDHAIDLAGRVKAAIGTPDQLVFQSWVTRAPIACGQSEPACLAQRCSTADPPHCGEKSIPLNLPDDDPAAFTQTRLVRAVLELFGGR
jgi:hypothetical protein